MLVDALDEAEPSGAGINRLFLPKRLPKGCFIVITNRRVCLSATSRPRCRSTKS